MAEKVKRKSKDEISFESALKELESIASRLEEGNLSLDRSIVEFERGMKLSNFCHAKLEEAEKKIEILQKNEAGGKIKKKSLKVDRDSGEIEDDDDLQGTLL